MTPVTGVNDDIRYEVHLDNGVRLTISLPKNRPGPGVMRAMIPGTTPYVVQLPGGIVAIHAPSPTAGKIDWYGIARALGARLILPPKPEVERKPEPEPYDQYEIPL